MQIRGTILFLLLSVAAFAQGGFYQDRAEGRLINGNALVAIPGAAVTVCSDSLCASPVNIYSNADLAIGHLIGTSTTADANGNFSFYVLPGQYFCQVAASGFSTAINPCQVSITLPNAVDTSSNQTIGGNKTWSGVNLFTTQLNFTNAGIYTNSQMNLYVQSILNGCNPLTEYQAMEGNLNATAPVTGCVAVPIGSTVHEVDGLLGIATGLSTLTNVVGMRGQARALAPNVHVWGGVSVASDGGFSDNEVLGHEIDIANFNSGSTGAGLTFGGTLTPGSDFVAIQIPTLVGGSWASGISFQPVGGIAVCTFCVDFTQGATPAPSGSGAAILFRAVTSGVNHVSQGFTFLSNDPSAGQNQVNVNEDAAGNLIVANSKVNTGISLNGSQVTRSIATGTATVDLASVASAACTADSADVTLTGAAVGDPVRVTAATALPAGVWLIGRVTATNTGRFQLCNLSGGAVDRASDTYTISVVK